MRQLIGILIALALWGCSDPGSNDPTSASAPPEPAENAAPGRAAPPEWLPDTLRLPADSEIVAERSLGRATRLLQVRTGSVGFADTLDQGSLLQIDLTMSNP